MSAESSPRSRAAELLETAERGSPDTVNLLIPLLYEELRALAHQQLGRERSDQTLRTTALVHEAYLKLVDHTRVTEHGRAYFFAAAAHAMRQVLVDRARRRNAAKRGGGVKMVSLGDDDAAVDAYASELLDLDDALQRLAGHSPRQVKVVEYRFFAGMNVEETAKALGVSPRTVESDWAMARAWLFRALGGLPSTPGSETSP